MPTRPWQSFGHADPQTAHHNAEDIIGRQFAAVVNFPPRQIGKFMSEVLALGFPEENVQ